MAKQIKNETENTTETTEATEVKVTEITIPYEEEKVDIYIPRTDKEKGDLYVSVNGHDFLLQRGRTVSVPRYIAEVIERSQRAEEDAEDRRYRLQRGLE